MRSHDSTSALADDNKNEAAIDLETLKADLTRIRSDLASISSSLIERGKNAIQGAGSDVGHYAQDSAKQVQDFVRERPVGTALVALGVGMVVGIILRKR